MTRADLLASSQNRLRTVIRKRPVDPPLEPEALHRDRLEAGLFPCPEQVQELSADRGVGFVMDHSELLGHVLG